MGIFEFLKKKEQCNKANLRELDYKGIEFHFKCEDFTECLLDYLDLTIDYAQRKIDQNSDLFDLKISAYKLEHQIIELARTEGVIENSMYLVENVAWLDVIQDLTAEFEDEFKNWYSNLKVQKREEFIGRISNSFYRVAVNLEIISEESLLNFTERDFERINGDLKPTDFLKSKGKFKLLRKLDPTAAALIIDHAVNKEFNFYNDVVVEEMSISTISGNFIIVQQSY